MTNVEKYIPLVKFLGSALGKNCEVVLHDVKNPEHSIVAIENGHVSGRSVGGPLTDLVLKVMREGLQQQNNYIVNYKAKGQGNRICRSSSYFIKDSAGEIEGVLCINFDISPLIEIRNYINDAIGDIPANKLPVCQEEKASNFDVLDVFENLQASIDDVLKSLIDKVLDESDVPPDRMSVEEKIEVVRKLNEHGLFLLKGGVSELSQRMKVSEATIYRYLGKVK